MYKILFIIGIICCDINAYNLNHPQSSSSNNNNSEDIPLVLSDLLLQNPYLYKYIKQFQKQFNRIWLSPSLDNRKIQNEYDFIIVGAGPAGCVLANRLSEINQDFTVLLVEAGEPELPNFTDVPLSSPNLQSTKWNWGYVTEIQNNSCLSMKSNRCSWPHGRGLGGSTIINYSIYTRGNRNDFDRLAIKNPGWSYANVLPYFRKSEKSTMTMNVDADYHGYDGLLHVEHPPFRTEISRAFIESSKLLGYKQLDYNGKEQLGVSQIQVTTKNGWRQTAAKSYLEPILNKRKNLQILTESRVIKLLFDDNKSNNNADKVKVIGIELINERRRHTVWVKKEIILSAGTFETPKLLMLSGIGPAEHLNELGIPLIKDLPVGQLLYEHVGAYGPIFTVNSSIDDLINIENVTQIKPIVNFYAGKGPLTSNGIESILYMKVNNNSACGSPSRNTDPNVPDLELLQALGTVAFDTAPGTRRSIRLKSSAYNSIFRPIENQRAFQFVPMLLHPESKGYLKLKSRNPFHHPLLYANFFQSSNDLSTILQGIRKAIEITEQKPFKKLGLQLYRAVVPGCEHTQFNTDHYWICYIKHLTATLHHQVGTCKMGPREDRESIVNSRLFVHGTENLRIGDISILPESPSAHTAAISFMIGEKLSDIIKLKWNKSSEKIVYHRKKRHFDWQKIPKQINSNDILIEKSNPENFNNTFNLPNGLLNTINSSSVIVNQTNSNSIFDIKSILWDGYNNSTSQKSHIEQILDKIPSVNEDLIRIVTLNRTTTTIDDRYGRRHGNKATKAKFITKLLQQMNTTTYYDTN